MSTELEVNFYSNRCVTGVLWSEGNSHDFRHLGSTASILAVTEGRTSCAVFTVQEETFAHTAVDTFVPVVLVHIGGVPVGIHVIIAEGFWWEGPGHGALVPLGNVRRFHVCNQFNRNNSSCVNDSLKNVERFGHLLPLQSLLFITCASTAMRLAGPGSRRDKAAIVMATEMAI